MNIPNLFELNERVKNELNKIDNFAYELGEFDGFLAQNYTDYLKKVPQFKQCPKDSKEQINNLLNGGRTNDIK